MGSGQNHQSCRPVDHLRLYDHRFYALFVMRAMGELLLSNLNNKSFSDFASDLLGPWGAILPAGPTGSALVVTGMADVGHHGVRAILVPGYRTGWFRWR